MEAWIARAARVHGDRTALSTAGGESLTYACLHARAARVAGRLHELGVGPGERVGLALGGEELVVALHGCMLLGAAAVPVDLRLGAAERAARTDGARVVLDRLEEASVSRGPAALAERSGAETATVMFTSG